MPNRAEVYAALDSERAYQLAKWKDLDDRNAIGDFLIYMERELRKAVDSYYSPDEPRGVMDAIRKVTTVGVAAMERFGAPRRESINAQ